LKGKPLRRGKEGLFFRKKKGGERIGSSSEKKERGLFPSYQKKGGALFSEARKPLSLV